MHRLARPLALALVALLALPAAAPAKSSKKPKHYTVGMATRSVAVPDELIKARNVYLGGYGLGNGRVGDSILGIDNPAKPADNGFPAYDDGRAADGNLDGGPSVRAAVVSAGRNSFAIADIENQGCFTQNKQGYGLVTMRLAVERRTKGALPADHVDVQCDHSHGGPDLIGAWGGVPTSYLKLVQERTVDAIVEAYKEQQPAELWYGTAQSGVEGRDQVPEDKNGNALLTNQMLNDPYGDNDVMDDELRVLQARDPGTGEPFATILNLNAHPTVLGSSNTKATGDWPQFANKLMESDPGTFGTKALTVVGTLGRQQPARGDCRDGSIPQNQRGDSNPAWAICKLAQYSQRVVERAKVALAAAKPITGTPKVVAKTYLIADTASNAGILALNDVGDLIGAPIMRSNTPPWRTGTVVGTVTGSALIGNVLLSSMPGEAYPQIPLAVRDVLKNAGVKGFMTAGLSNDQLGYIIAPVPEGYPYPIQRAVVDQNDNMLFNASQTLGERLTCSLLRGAGEVLGKGNRYWQAYDKCVAFASDMAFPEGADVAPFPAAT
jgi:hypothetical protein